MAIKVNASKSYGRSKNGALRVNASRSTEKNNGSALGYLGLRTLYGAAGLVEGFSDFVVGSVYQMAGDKAYAKYLHDNDVVGGWERALDRSYNPGKGMRVAGDIASGVGQALPSVGLGIATGGLSAAARTAVGVAGSVALGTAYAGRGVTRAVQETGELSARENWYGILSGASEAATDFLLGGTQKAGKAIWNVTKSGSKAAAGKIARNGLMKGIWTSASSEFAEEFIQEYMDTGLLRATGVDADASTSFGDALYSGMIGFFTGGLLGGATNTIKTTSNIARGKSVRERGLTGNLLATANHVRSEYLGKDADFTKINSEALKFLSASVDAYNKLEVKEGTRADMLLGEIQAGLFAFENEANIRKIKREITTNPTAKKAAHISEMLGTAVTAEDLVNNRNGIADRAAVMSFTTALMSESRVDRVARAVRDAVVKERYANVREGASFDGSLSSEGERVYRMDDGRYAIVTADNREGGEGKYRLGFSETAEYDENRVKMLEQGATAEEIKQNLAGIANGSLVVGEKRLERAQTRENALVLNEGAVGGQVAEQNAGEAQRAENGGVEADDGSHRSALPKTREARERKLKRAQAHQKQVKERKRAERSAAERIATEIDRTGEPVASEQKDAGKSPAYNRGYTDAEANEARGLVGDFDTLSPSVRRAIVELVRSGKASGASKSFLKHSANLIAYWRRGLWIIADDKTRDDGFYTSFRDGSRLITVKPNREANAVADTLMHELAHDVWARADADMRRVLYELATVDAKAEEIDAVRKRYRDELTNRGELDGMAEAEVEALLDEEVATNLIGEIIGKEEFLGRFDGSETSTIKRILRTLSNMKKRFTGKDRFLYRKADDLFTAFTKVMALEEVGEIDVRDGKRHAFAGTTAKTADKIKLATAQEMIGRGIDSEMVRKETGWFRGYDGKWRFEIDDSTMQIAFNGKYSRDTEIRRYAELVDKVYFLANATQAEQAELVELDKKIGDRSITPTKLGDIIYHPTLFEAYPQLKEVGVRFVDGMGNTNGAWDAQLNEIVISKNLKRQESKVKRTLLHEIQHAIQYIEGFAKGASPEYWAHNPIYAKEGNEELHAAEKKLDEVYAKFRKLWKDDINWSLAKEYIRLQDLWWESPNTEYYERKLADIESAAEESGWGDLLDEYLEADARYTLAQRKAKRIPVNELYQRTAGEIEARDVASRAELTEEQRKNTRQDIDREDVVFADDSEVSKDFIGWTADGIECYKTDPAIMQMSIADRIKKFQSDFLKQFKGRTAKFIRNGHTYYARFVESKKGLGKFAYEGNNPKSKSDDAGYRAKIRLIANGDIFDIVEDGAYKKSEKEIGKKTAAHKNAKYWDYFWKEIFVDGKGYDVVINIRNDSKTTQLSDKQQFVYSMSFNENKKVATPVTTPATSKQVGVNLGSTTNDSISQNPEKSTDSAEKVSENVGAKRKALAKTDAEEVENRRRLAAEKFGFTNDVECAGFVLPDGRMLNLSQYGLKGVQHKRIEAVFEDLKGDDAINRFVQDGNVRLKASSPGIEIGESGGVTVSQRNTIRRFIDTCLARNDRFFLDITAEDGSDIASFEYDSDTSTSDIIYDIEKYYERGLGYIRHALPKPSGDEMIEGAVMRGYGDKLGVNSQTSEKTEEKKPVTKPKKTAAQVARENAERRAAAEMAQVEEQAARTVRRAQKSAENTVKNAETFAAQKIASTEEQAARRVRNAEKSAKNATKNAEKKLAAETERLARESMEHIYRSSRESARLNKNIEYLKNEVLHRKSTEGGLASSIIFGEPSLRAVVKVFAGRGSAYGIMHKSTRAGMQALLDWYRPDNEVLNGNAIDELLPSGGKDVNAVFGAYNADIRTRIERIANGVGNITAGELADLDVVVNAVARLYQTYGTVKWRGKRIDASRLAYEAYRDMLDTRRVLATGREADGKPAVVLKKIWNVVREGYLYGVVTPEVVLRDLEHYSKKGVLSSLYREIRYGEAEAKKIRTEILMPVAEFFDKHKKYRRGLSTERRIEFGGHKITAAQAVGIWETSKREHAAGRMFDEENGGIRISVYDAVAGITETRRVKVTEVDLGNLYNQFSEEDKGYIKALEEAFKIATKYKEQTDGEVWGYTNTVKGHYYPITTDENYFARDVTDVRQLMSSVQVVNNKTFNKNTVEGAQAWLFIEDSLRVLERHAMGMGAYSGLFQPLQTFGLVYGAKFDPSGFSEKGVDDVLVESVVKKTSLREHYNAKLWNRDGGSGTNLDKYLTKLFSDVQGLVGETTAIDKVVSWIQGNYVTATFGLNAKIILTQLASYATAEHNLDADVLVRALGMKNEGEAMDKYSRITKARSFDGVGAAEGLVDKLGELGRVATKGIDFTDRGVIVKLYNACRLQVEKDGGPAIDSEENLKAAAKLLDDLLLDTQTTSLKADASALMRSKNAVAKMFTMFRTESMKAFSNVYAAFATYANHRSFNKNGLAGYGEEVLAEDKKKIGKTVTAYLMSMTWVAAMTVLFSRIRKAARGEKEDEKLLVEGVREVVGNVVELLPIFSEIYSYATDRFDVEYIPIGVINDTLSMLANVGKLTDRDASDAEKARYIRTSVHTLGNILGLPAKNAGRVALAITSVINKPTAYRVNDKTDTSPTYRSDLDEALEKGNDRLAQTVLSTWFSRQKGGKASSAVSDEILRLYKIVDGEGKSIFSMPKSVPSDLDSRQSGAFSSVYSEADDQIAALVASGAYAALDDRARAKAIKAAYDMAWSRAAASVGLEDTGSALGMAQADVDSVIMAAVAGFAKAYEGSDRKAQVVAYLKSLGLSKAEYNKYLLALGYKAEA